MSAPIAAVVFASRGGSRLGRALASVAWASERLVIDPAGRVANEALPAGIRRPADAVAAASAPWVLLLDESEAVSGPLAAEIAAAVDRPDAAAAYRIGVEVKGLGVTLRPCGRPVRLARRTGSRVRLGAGVRLELEASAGPVGRLDGRLVSAAVGSLTAALEELDSDAAGLAALLHAERVTPRLRHLALTPLLPAARMLLARGGTRGLWPRWGLAVFAGYRAAVAYAKLWEMRRAERAHAP